MGMHSTISLDELWDNPAVLSMRSLSIRYGFSDIMTLSIGPHTVANGWEARDCMSRLWLYARAAIETNVYLLYNLFTNNTNISRQDWKCALADALILQTASLSSPARRLGCTPCRLDHLGVAHTAQPAVPKAVHQLPPNPQP